MIISLPFEIPQNTTSKTKLDEVRIPEGVITKVHINIPPGWNYTAGISLETNGRVIVPTNGDEYITGNGLDVTLEPYMYVKEGSLYLHGINQDTVYPHSGVVIIELIPLEELVTR